MQEVPQKAIYTPSAAALRDRSPSQGAADRRGGATMGVVAVSSVLLASFAATTVASPTNCTVRLTTGQSTTPCVLGTTFGCEKSNSSNMWAGGGCRGLFACDGARDVACGGGFGKKVICPCVTAPPPAPAPHPPGMPLCASLNQSSFCTCGPGRRYPGPGDGQCWSCPSCPAPPAPAPV